MAARTWWQITADTIIAGGQVLAFIGDSFVNLFMIVAAIVSVASIDEHSIGPVIALVVIYKIHRWRRKKSKLTRRSNKSPVSTIKTTPK